MDITNENFIETLPLISETIKGCDFIAIDTELSGLMRERSLNRFDLPEERFSKAVDSSRGYFILQFGLSCFTKCNDNYNSRTYNFYIFPQPNKEYGDMDRTFSLQAHAIQFLRQHRFDFNKLFDHGLSYLTFQEKKVLTAKLKSDAKARSKVEMSNGLPKFVPSQMATLCRNWLKKVKKFVEERKSDMIDPTVINEDILQLRDCSTHQRRKVLIRVLECSPLFENLEIIQEDTFVAIKFVDKKLKSEKHKNALVMAKGFLEILEVIILAKKPLVGHNLILDLIQIINQFIEPLSDDYNSFKETCHSLFPLIYDTKFIAHSILDPDTLTNNQSRLNDLYCQLRENSSFPQFKINHLEEFFDENQMPHQAGYDAYMSGYCFLALAESYIREEKCKLNEVDGSIAMQERVIDKFANKIHLSYSYDFKYYDLAGDEEEPNRNHVFYVEFPSTWEIDDLFQAFSKHGGVTACKLSRSSALCALRDPEKAKSVLKEIELSKPSSYRVYSYATYLERFKPKRETDPDVEMSD